jgi:hypothetical protein
VAGCAFVALDSHRRPATRAHLSPAMFAWDIGDWRAMRSKRNMVEELWVCVYQH